MVSPSATLLLLSAGHGAIPGVVHRPASELRIAVITTAANPSMVDGSVPPWLQSSMRALQTLDFSFEPFDITERSSDETEAALADRDVLYVSGGNTFYLLHQIRATGFDRTLSRFLADPERLYIGASAGAAVLGPHIGYTAPIDDPAEAPQLVDWQGLGHLSFCVVPHVAYDDRGEVSDPQIRGCLSRIGASQYDAVALRDDQALLVSSSTARVIPSGPIDEA